MRLAQTTGEARRPTLITLAVIALAALLLLHNLLPAPDRAPSGGGSIQPAAPPTATEALIWSLQRAVEQNPASATPYARLGQAYLQRVRETGDASLYAQAEVAFERASRLDPADIEVLIGSGQLALARHDFATALKLGTRARELEPTIPRVYGVIGDAQVELGMYAAAVETIQVMADLRPDLGSYTRISYLRELHGDVPGAIEAMQRALSAAGGGEAGEWTRVQLGHLYFKSGQLELAERQYRATLARMPEYLPAQVAHAKVLAARGELDAAVRMLEDTTARIPAPEAVIELAEMYAAHGDDAAARKQIELVLAIDRLQAQSGVNTDLELALFMADHDLDLAKSLEKARAAYAARPSIYAADVLAWTLYKSGKPVEAARYADEALRLDTRDALLLFHRGMIAAASGDRELAVERLQRALSINPAFSLRYTPEAEATLRQLGAEPPAKGRR